MSRTLNRYASAVTSSHLESSDRAETDIDVIGAAGIARKRGSFGVSIMRLDAGDLSELGPARHALAEKLLSYAGRQRIKLTKPAAESIAKAAIGWALWGHCKPCEGRGQYKVEGTSRLGNVCASCRGTRKTPIEAIFPASRIDLARWAIGRIEEERNRACSTVHAVLRA